jgi:2-oxoglutarate ferredoxin oxidoreductase subunit gamma
VQYEVMFAGFGGQGILAIGQILAKAAMEEGKHVVWLPSYGPEMRGGTASCTVVISEKEIGSPIISNPRCAAVLNLPSFDKFSPLVKAGGLLIINSSLIDVRSDRTDVDQLLVPANDLAIKAGTSRAMNMAILGSFVGRSKLVSKEAARRSIEEKLGKRKDTLATNLKVFDAGFEVGSATSKS